VTPRRWSNAAPNRGGTRTDVTITTEALEPIRQGVTEHFGAVAKDIVTKLQLHHDYGSNSMSKNLRKEITFLGIKASALFVREPEGNGVVERLIRPLSRTSVGPGLRDHRETSPSADRPRPLVLR
jgi:hypothetical protein